MSKKAIKKLRVTEEENSIIEKVVKARKKDVLLSEESVGFSATTRWLYKKEHELLLAPRNSNAEELK